jgi:hypothetical protein
MIVRREVMIVAAIIIAISAVLLAANLLGFLN